MRSGSKKTRSLQTKETCEVSWTPNSVKLARNLSKRELGAVIFGCKHHTFDECLVKKLFGLPASHYKYVRNVTPGLTLFLFNYSDRKLHGIFEAASPGQLNINSHAWITNEAAEVTPYAAQVRVDIWRQCRPLYEEEFKPIIASNYYAKKLFWFELDKDQSRKLTELFLSSLVPEKPRPPNAVKRNNISNHIAEDGTAQNTFEDLDPRECSEICGQKLINIEHSSTLGFVNNDTFAQEKEWSELVKASSSSSVVNIDKCLESQNARFNISLSDNLDFDWDWAYDSSPHQSKLLPEPCPDVVNMEPDSPVIQSLEDLEVYENKDSCLKVQLHDSCPDFSNMPCLDEEAGELKPSEFEPEVVKMPEDALIGSKENVRSDNALASMENYHDYHKIDCNATSAEVLTDMMPSTFESVIIKLAQEIEGLKLAQLQQKQKIECLEQVLVAANLENYQVKNQYHESGTNLPYARNHFDVEDCKFPNFPLKETVLIVGGFDGLSWLPDLSSYSPSQDHVLPLCPMSFTRSYTSIAQLNGELYLFGGICDNVWYDTVESYNLMSNQWFRRPSLNKRKGSLAGASLCEKIFAIGGGNGVECYSEVELFDINIGRWISIQPMLEKRFALAATDINGAIYVAGGYDGSEYLRSVERFDPRERAWTRLASMNMKRGCHSLVAFKEKIYALGGFNGDKMVSTVEVFDPRLASWTMAEPMVASRGYFGSFVFGGKIYVIGGMEDGEILDTVECYEEGSGWQVTDLAGIGKRCFFSALVL